MKAITSKTIIVAKPYTQKELSQIYGVCRQTFASWLKPFAEELGKKHGRFYSAKQVKLIFKKLDFPSEYELR